MTFCGSDAWISKWTLARRRRTGPAPPSARSLGEVKRRTKVMGRFPGESSCLRLSWAVMDLVVAGGAAWG
jgi:hypothetical protein